MSVREDLLAAKALIDTPEKWLQGEFDRNECFCTVGALRRVCLGPKEAYPFRPENWDRLETARANLNEHNPERGALTLEGFNDHWATTHDDVMALFDRAIAAAAEGDPS